MEIQNVVSLANGVQIHAKKIHLQKSTSRVFQVRQILFLKSNQLHEVKYLKFFRMPMQPQWIY